MGVVNERCVQHVTEHNSLKRQYQDLQNLKECLEDEVLKLTVAVKDLQNQVLSHCLCCFYILHTILERFIHKPMLATRFLWWVFFYLC